MPPSVLAAYADALRLIGNPASVHSAGQNSKRMLEESRERVAAALGAEPVNVIFTSGGTESVNLAIKGIYWARSSAAARRPRLLLPGTEHHAAIDAAEWLVRRQGARIDWIPVDDAGLVLPTDLDSMLSGEPESVALVSVMLANNETGVIAPLAELVELAHRYGVPVHSDAVSALGSIPIDFGGLGIDALSISGHKIGAPVGIGALLLSRGTVLEPLLHGGNQQRVRSGTQDAAGALAFATATELAVASLAAEARRLAALRDHLIEGVRHAVPSAVLRGPEPGTSAVRPGSESGTSALLRAPESGTSAVRPGSESGTSALLRDPEPDSSRLPGTALFTFPGCEGDSLVFLLDASGYSVSTGAACQAGVPETSHVLRSMGVSEADARGALRISIGRDTTLAEVDAFVAALPAAFARAARAGLASA